MKRKTRYIAFNSDLFICIIFLALSTAFAWLAIRDKELIPAIISVFVGLPALFVLLISPILFIFTEHDITIVYWFGLREAIKWSSIRSIWETGSWISRGGGTPRYVLSYPRHGKKAFFMNGEITKTFRTKHLIKKFWKKKII